MRLMFEMDKKDYDPGGTVSERPSCRGIIVRDGRVALIHSLKYDYYKFPGGGIEKGESRIDALVREVLEETGMRVIPDTIREYGYVHRAQKGLAEDVFIQDNFYCFCEAEEVAVPLSLDDYEREERFVLEYAKPSAAIEVNRRCGHGDERFAEMLYRENRMLEMLSEEYPELFMK